MAGNIPAGLPTLTRVPLPTLDSLLPRPRPAARFALSSSGHLAFETTVTGDDDIFAILDTLGNVVARMGRVGTGPGETGRGNFLGFSTNGEELVVIDGQSVRILRYALNGRHIATSDTFDAGVPIRIDSDSVDMVMLDFSDGVAGELRRTSVRDLRSRTWLPEEHSFMQSLRMQTLSLPTANSTRVIFADPMRYRFQVFHRDGSAGPAFGRDLEPVYRSDAAITTFIAMHGDSLAPSDTAAMRQRLKEQMPYFTETALDENNRLWAIGRDSAGSAYADVFADTTYVGRTTIPCVLSAAPVLVKANWLATRCAVGTDPAVSQIALFRITYAAHIKPDAR